MEEYLTQIGSILNPPVSADEIGVILTNYTAFEVLDFLEKYGHGMLGVLYVMSANQLYVTFSDEVTLGDGNCYMYSLQNQAKENPAVRDTLTNEQRQELSMEVLPMRRLWCETGKHLFSGDWGSRENWRGNMSEEDWLRDWRRQSQNYTYDGTNLASDMFVTVGAHRLRRHIVIIDSVAKNLRVINGNFFFENNVTDPNPFILAHTRNHYQSMVPYPDALAWWQQFCIDEIDKMNQSAVVPFTNTNNVSTPNNDSLLTENFPTTSSNLSKIETKTT